MSCSCDADWRGPVGEGGVKTYSEAGDDVDSARVPDVVLAILGAGAEESARVVPLHLLQLGALQLEGNDLSLGKHVPNAAGAITTRSLRARCRTSIPWPESRRRWDCTPCSGSSGDVRPEKARAPRSPPRCPREEPSTASRHSAHTHLRASRRPPLPSSEGTSRTDRRRRTTPRTFRSLPTPTSHLWHFSFVDLNVYRSDPFTGRTYNCPVGPAMGNANRSPFVRITIWSTLDDGSVKSV